MADHLSNITALHATLDKLVIIVLDAERQAGRYAKDTDDHAMSMELMALLGQLLRMKLASQSFLAYLSGHRLPDSVIEAIRNTPEFDEPEPEDEDGEE